MTRDEKSDLVLRLLGLKHKIKVHDSMKSPETHEELSHSLLARWELEDELKAIEQLLEASREENVRLKKTQLKDTYLSGAPVQKPRK
jgi:hypothetical protein